MSNPDSYRGKFTDKNTNIEDLGEKYANEVKLAIDAAHADGHTIAAYYAESLQSCGGQIIPPPGYLQQVYK